MSRKILIVDDEASAGESLSEKLSQQGFDCQTAASGEEALRWTAHNSFDVIISDLKMPGWRCRPVGGVRTLPGTDYL
jgi:DNA-binding response OmpR family regulator